VGEQPKRARDGQAGKMNGKSTRARSGACPVRTSFEQGSGGGETGRKLKKNTREKVLKGEEGLESWKKRQSTTNINHAEGKRCGWGKGAKSASQKKGPSRTGGENLAFQGLPDNWGTRHERGKSQEDSASHRF